MKKFYNEEKNMLENYPEIRDASLRKKPSFLEKTLWKRWYKGVSAAVLAITLPTAIVCTLSACTPTVAVDEQQQKAYKNYLSAWGQYENAVTEYNKIENADKPSLPANLVLTKTLDDKATTDNLKSETQKLETATVNILNLCEIYNNNQDDPAQKVAYQNYLSAWNTYQAAVAEYEALENEEKPALPANLVLAKSLDDKATTKELNDARAALENATAEINKLIQQYEQETPTPPVIDYDKLTPADLTEEQKEIIVKNVTTALEKNIKRNIGNTGVINEVLSIEFNNNDLTLLVNYTNDTLGNMIGMYKYTMANEVNYKALIVDGITPASATAKGEKIVEFSTKSNDNRANEVLAKLNPQIAATNPQFISLTNVAGDVISIGGTNVITIYTINSNGISKVVTNARSDGDRTDPIGQSILAESATVGKDYTAPTTETFEFGKNVLLLGEMFKGNDSNEF